MKRSKSKINSSVIGHCSGQAFVIDVFRAFFIEPDDLRFSPLESLSSLVIGLEANCAFFVALVFNVNELNGIANTCFSRSTIKSAKRQKTRTKLANGPKKFLLNDISCGFSCVPSSPDEAWAIDSVACPPIRVVSGRVANGLETPSDGLSHAVSGHEATFSVVLALFEELKMFWVQVTSQWAQGWEERGDFVLLAAFDLLLYRC